MQNEINAPQIVLGDSSVVNANSTTNQDLFQVLKGGGNNFGRYNECLKHLSQR